MSDRLVARIDAIVREHEASIERLRQFRDLYVKSPELRSAIAELVGNEAITKDDTADQTALFVPAKASAPTPWGRGTTDAILAIVKEKPGIRPSDLIDTVLTRITPTAKKPRRAIASTYDYLLGKHRLERRDGRFYPVG